VPVPEDTHGSAAESGTPCIRDSRGSIGGDEPTAIRARARARARARRGRRGWAALFLGLDVLLIALGGCSDGEKDGGTQPPRAATPRRDAEALPDAEVDAALIACRLNSDCPPGFYCKDAVCSFDCRVDRDCPRGWVCESGECTEPMPDPPCVDDRACGAPTMVCDDGACVPGCGGAGCPGGQACDAATGRCGDAPGECNESGCGADEVCDASGVCLPVERCDPGSCGLRERCDQATGECVPRCEAGDCAAGQRCDAASGMCVPDDRPPPDCTTLGCPAGQRCDAPTGDCVPDGPADGDFASQCVEGRDCTSDICLGLANGGGVCSKLCCDEAECPLGSGCIYFNGVRVCVPGEVVGFDFDLREGQACGGVGECQSDLCDDRCLGTCCTTADCGGRVCRWAPTLLGERPRALCDVPLGFGQTGAPCGEDPLLIQFDCLSNVCVANPDFGQPGQAPGVCADLCCTHADCPAGTGCGQVIGPPEGNGTGNVVTACVPLPRGQTPDGDACASDEACQSGHCVEAVCRQPCCTDNHCPQPLRCLPRDGEQGIQIRVCAEPVR
ncbi:MAG: hypothetical protein KC583_04655, partial [Myxococcales bacterium]|nr:hypothetical protein [Myxococcales bacterium]